MPSTFRTIVPNRYTNKWVVANCQWPNHNIWQNFQDKETEKAKHSRAIHATCCQLREVIDNPCTITDCNAHLSSI